MNVAARSEDPLPDVILLPTLSPRSAMHRELMAQVTRARDAAQDPALRRALDDVLSGHRDLRSAFANGPLAAAMATAGRRMRDELAELTPQERAELRVRAEQAGTHDG